MKVLTEQEILDMQKAAKVEVLEALYKKFKISMPFGEGSQSCLEIAKQINELKEN